MLVQQITPEVLQWIAAQAQAGHKPDAVLQVMRASGWDEQIALSAIEHSQRGSLDAPPASIEVPEPFPNGAAWSVRTADREMYVAATMQLPRVVVFDNVLSSEECAGFIELARAKLRRSQTIDAWSGGEAQSDWRTSEGMFFEPGENELVQRLEHRIAEMVNWPVECGEGLQVLRYRTGAQYRPHYDYFDPTVAGMGTLLKRGGPRVATVVTYLNTPERGGGTAFCDAGFEVAPRAGRAVFFSYNCPHPTTRTLHAGAPVIEGEKWVATKWLRSEPFKRHST